MTYLSILPKIRRFLGLDASGSRSPLVRSFAAFLRWVRRELDLDPSRRPSSSPRRFRPCLEGLETRLAPAQTFTVTSIADDGSAGTLRWAIGQANLPANSGSTINISIGNTVGTIQTIILDPTKGGLTISQPMTINGLTQGGGPLQPWVNVTGNNTIAGDGLTIQAGGVTIEGLAIYGFGGSGIVLNQPNGQPGDAIWLDDIGTDATGTVLEKNGANGITINSPDNTIGGTVTSGGNGSIGGTSQSGGNVISGNGGEGILLTGPEATRNVISRNFIGTDITGLKVGFGNTDGIRITGGANANTIGGPTGLVNPGNVICSSTGQGLLGDGILIEASNQTQVFSNYIGVGADGKTNLGNAGDGILIRNGATGNTIGSNSSNTLNVISGNTNDGVQISNTGTTANVVQGDYIGIAQDGKTAVGNSNNGVRLDTGASGNTIGGTGAFMNSVGGSQGNVISGNSVAGVSTDFSTTTVTNVIQGNYIGTDSTGTVAVPNATGLSIFAARNIIGGNMMSTGNLISGNTGDGLSLGGSSNQVLGNLIGTEVSGTGALSNGGNGVTITGSNNTIGGSNTMSTVNVISGNTGDGVSLGGSSNQVLGNLIGTNLSGSTAVSNGGNGVRITGSNNTVGGLTSDQGNTISGNNNDGIYLNGATSNQILSNYIGTNKGGTGFLSGALRTLMSNGANGVEIYNSSNNSIGAVGAGNVISGNGVSGAAPAGNNGVYIWNGSANNAVQANKIGTDVTGTTAIGNSGDGVFVAVTAGTGNTVGGTAANQGNIISANGAVGETNGWGIDFDVAVVEDFNTIGLGSGGGALPNRLGGSATGVYGPNDKHQ